MRPRLALCRERTQQVKAVAKSLRKRPASTARKPPKRTPFNLKREGRLIVGGVKRAIFKGGVKRPARA